MIEAQDLFANSRMNFTAGGKRHPDAGEYRISWRIFERFSKKLGQLTYHVVSYCRNETSSGF